MSTAIQIFNHPEFGDVRVVNKNGEPLFVGKDVALALGYSNPRDALAKHVPDKFKRVSQIATPGGNQDMTLITEAGLYKLVFASKLPKAVEFSDWTCEEVIPSIRKTGVYMTTKAAEEILSNPDFIIELAQQVKAARAQIEVLNTQVAELQTKANYCDVVLQCKELVTTSVIAKDYGYSAKAFNKLLHELGVQFRQSDIWLLYQEYAAQGWSQTKTHIYYDEDGKPHSKPHMYWTQKGRLGLYELLKAKNILPLIEQ
ncbi:MAG: phage antirepressor KilAC domain-containing protein [Selenomonadaceae bacterium]|nr:phage antirepressor KilAC domain-containing protein [Selenomonadaceae bacterium]